MAPTHEIWDRTRLSHHGGAIRPYLQPTTPTYGRSIPPRCIMCMKASSIVGKRSRLASYHDCYPLDLLDEIDLGTQDFGKSQGQ